MISVKQETLQRALEKTGLRELPKPATDNRTVWITAIVMVEKTGGIQSYCLASNDGEGGIAITNDFGPSLAIVRMLAVYPVETLDKRFRPDLRSDKQIIAFLAKNGYDEAAIAKMLDNSAHDSAESLNADRQKVRAMVNKTAIKLSQQTLAEEERCRNIGMKDRIGDEEQD